MAWRCESTQGWRPPNLQGDGGLDLGRRLTGVVTGPRLFIYLFIWFALWVSELNGDEAPHNRQLAKLAVMRLATNITGY
jgi:hypothetical protein